MSNNYNFNSEVNFNKDINDIILSLLQQPIKDLIEFSIDTHNADGLKKLLAIIKEYRY